MSSDHAPTGGAQRLRIRAPRPRAWRLPGGHAHSGARRRARRRHAVQVEGRGGGGEEQHGHRGSHHSERGEPRQRIASADLRHRGTSRASVTRESRNGQWPTMYWPRPRRAQASRGSLNSAVQVDRYTWSAHPLRAAPLRPVGWSHRWIAPSLVGGWVMGGLGRARPGVDDDHPRLRGTSSELYAAGGAVEHKLGARIGVAVGAELFQRNKQSTPVPYGPWLDHTISSGNRIPRCIT